MKSINNNVLLVEGGGGGRNLVGRSKAVQQRQQRQRRRRRYSSVGTIPLTSQLLLLVVLILCCCCYVDGVRRVVLGNDGNNEYYHASLSTELPHRATATDADVDSNVTALFVTEEDWRRRSQRRRRRIASAEDEDDEGRLPRRRRLQDEQSQPQQREAASTRDNVQVDVPDSPDGHLVTSLPLFVAGGNDEFPTQQWAGHLPASSEGDKYFFYWLFGPDLSAVPNAKEEDAPLLIWLNGGPACSSMDGLFLENGPFRLTLDPNGSDKQYRLTMDPNSWTKAPAYTLYIDQPVGTGLSFTTSGKYPTNDEEVNVDFYYFLQSFLALHGDKFVDAGSNTFNRPLYFSGESHAGHYIPSMMNYILKQNDSLAKTDSNAVTIPLAGAAIGNGWIHPYYQYSASEAAYGHGLVRRLLLLFIYFCFGFSASLVISIFRSFF